jgi:hypothetical protein
MNNQASGVTLTHRQNVLFSFFIDLSIVSSGRNSSSKKKNNSEDQPQRPRIHPSPPKPEQIIK